MDVGKRITELRIQRNLTTNKLANLSGVSQSYLRDVEMGNKNPIVEFLSYICQGLHITLHNFFSEESLPIDPHLLQILKSFSPVQQKKLADFLESTANLQK